MDQRLRIIIMRISKEGRISHEAYHFRPFVLWTFGLSICFPYTSFPCNMQLHDPSIERTVSRKAVYQLVPSAWGEWSYLCWKFFFSFRTVMNGRPIRCEWVILVRRWRRVSISATFHLQFFLLLLDVLFSFCCNLDGRFVVGFLDR